MIRLYEAALKGKAVLTEIAVPAIPNAVLPIRFLRDILLLVVIRDFPLFSISFTLYIVDFIIA